MTIPVKNGKIKQQKDSEKPSLMDLLKNRSYMMVFGGQLTNFIAGILVGMTFSYLIYATTQNAALMALMNIIGILPSVIITLFAGVIVDRYDQRKILFIAMILRSLVFVGFLLIYLFRNLLVIEYNLLVPYESGGNYTLHIFDYTHFIWPMYLLLFISNVGGTFLSLSMSAYSKYIITKKNLLVANSFNQTIVQISSVIGPLAAGAIITISYLYSFIIGVSIISLATVLALVLLYFGKKPPKVEIEKQDSFKAEIKQVFKDLRVGYVATKSQPKILFALIIYVMFNFATASVNGVFTVVTQGEIGLNPTWMGILQATMAGVAIITSLVFLKVGKINRKLIIVLSVLFAETIGLFLFAFNRNPWILVCVTTIPFGFVNGAANIPTQTLRQELFSHEIQGRVFSVAVLCTSLANLIGNTIVASITNHVKPMYILIFGGSLCFLVAIGGLIAYMKMPELHCSDYTEKVDVIEEIVELDITLEKDQLDSAISSLIVETKDKIPSLE